MSRGMPSAAGFFAGGEASNAPCVAAGSFERFGSQRIRASHSSLGSIGLMTESFIPALMHRRRSCSMALAVMAITGSCASRGILRISRVQVTPSITGICMSMNTRSYRLSCSLRRAIAPLSATSTTRFAASSISRATSWLMSLSSTSRIRAPRNSSRGSGSAIPAERATRFAGAIAGICPPSTPNTPMVLSNSRDGLTGLTSTPAMPTALASWTISSRPCDETIMRIGGCSSPSAWIRRAVSMPSMLGMRQSR